MRRRTVQKLDPQLRLRELLWLVAILVVAFADVVVVQYLLPLFGR